MSQQRVLPADVYDTLELGALEWGGIAGGAWWQSRDRNCPNCAHGILVSATGSEDASVYALGSPSAALFFAGVSGGDSDMAVWRVNRRRAGVSSDARVPFKEWCAELNIIRGD